MTLIQIGLTYVKSQMADSDSVNGLTKTEKQLELEAIEYERYKQKLVHSNKELYAANQKLLRSLKEKYRTFLKLSRQVDILNMRIERKCQKYQEKCTFKEELRPLFGKSAEDAQEMIEPSLGSSKMALRELKDELVAVQESQVVEGGENDLLIRKQTVELEIRKLKEDIEVLVRAFDKLCNKRRITSSVQKMFMQMQKDYETCARLRRDKLKLIAYLNAEDKKRLLSPKTVFHAFGFELDTSASLSQLSAACATTTPETSEPGTVSDAGTSQHHRRRQEKLESARSRRESQVVSARSHREGQDVLSSRTARSRLSSSVHVDDNKSSRKVSEAGLETGRSIKRGLQRQFSRSRQSIRSLKFGSSTPRKSMQSLRLAEIGASIIAEEETRKDVQVQTDEGMKRSKAAFFAQELAKHRNMDKLNDSILDMQDELADLEFDILDLTKQKEKKMSHVKEIMRNLVLTSELPVINCDVRIPAEVTSIAIQTELIPDIEVLKDQIMKNTLVNPRQLLVKQTKCELEDILSKRNVELRVREMAIVRKDLDIKNLLNKLRIIDPILYSTETHEPTQIRVEPEILAEHDDKVTQIEKMTLRLSGESEREAELAKQIEDLQYMVNDLKKKLQDMANGPRSDVISLCQAIQEDRKVLKETARQHTFVRIEGEYIDDLMFKIKKHLTPEALEASKEKVDKAYAYLRSIKDRFNTLRAVHERRTHPLSSPEEVQGIQNTISETMSEIDLYRMKINGLISRIEKQSREITSKSVRLPEPFGELKRHD